MHPARGLPSGGGYLILLLAALLALTSLAVASSKWELIWGAHMSVPNPRAHLLTLTYDSTYLLLQVHLLLEQHHYTPRHWNRVFLFCFQ